ncbi:MAG TPA: hypothetical protein VFX49_01070 [Chloroflexota bacterium]|nr:hypothetical protein [Chloroflexota bacterium]
MHATQQAQTGRSSDLGPPASRTAPRGTPARAGEAADAERVRLGNREFAGFLLGGAFGGYAGASLDDPVALVLGLVFGAAVGAAIGATVFRRGSHPLAGGRARGRA